MYIFIILSVFMSMLVLLLCCVIRFLILTVHIQRSADCHTQSRHYTHTIHSMQYDLLEMSSVLKRCDPSRKKLLQTPPNAESNPVLTSYCDAKLFKVVHVQ